MRFLYSLAAIMAISTVFGQNNFVQITPDAPNLLRIDDIFFVSPDIGYACRGNRVLKITNQGATIEEVYSAGLMLGGMRSIEFFNPDTGIVGRLSNSGANQQPMLRTVNGGADFETLQVDPVMPGICGMHALENGTIYACGAYFGPGYYYKSTDFGTTWTFYDMSEFTEAMVDVLFISESVGFMGGQSENGGILLKTENAGDTWETVYESDIPTDYIWKIHTMEGETNVMYAALQSEAGPASIDYIWSEDGGDSWEARHATEWGDTQDIIFIDSDTAFITGHPSLPLHRSVDGGNTWEIAGDVLNGNRFFIVDSANIYLSGNHIHKYGGISETLNTPNETIYTTTVSVFPNPASDKVTIEATSLYADHIIVSLLSAEGKYITTLGKQNLFSGKNDVKLSLPDLPAGLYLLHIHTHSGVQIKRLVIE